MSRVSISGPGRGVLGGVAKEVGAVGAWGDAETPLIVIGVKHLGR